MVFRFLSFHVIVFYTCFRLYVFFRRKIPLSTYSFKYIYLSLFGLTATIHIYIYIYIYIYITTKKISKLASHTSDFSLCTNSHLTFSSDITFYRGKRSLQIESCLLRVQTFKFEYLLTSFMCSLR